MNKSDNKDYALEGLRGMAALVVVIYHALLGFWPFHSGIFPQYDATSWQGYPFFVFMNGGAAVALFFVLSGYVLVRKYLLTGDVQTIVRGVVKRYPRLMGPIFIAIMFSYLLFVFHLYSYEDAAVQSQSPWLYTFGNAYRTPFKPSFWTAVAQGLFLNLTRGDGSYDSSLWTMRIELIGSLIAYGMAILVYNARRLSSTHVFSIILLVVIVVLCHFSIPYLVAFPLGVVLASILPANKKTSCGVFIAATVGALYLLGYSGSSAGAYLPFTILGDYNHLYTTYPNIIGAIILIYLCETYAPMRDFMSDGIFRFLGRYSFPVYLVQTPVICSVGAALYLHYGTLCAVFGSIVASYVIAMPLVWFNDWWLCVINKGAARLCPAPQV
ncbi:MAG: acyltransferase [Alphaproteobacteria bacterium]|nr:acyltransferase [Alphaproteobacteria bacterium]MBV8549204.1 acyltransferase [Alphaproteobacteria bacterium]